ncbi:hypothetical protein C4559_04290 [Candidatus Microgenomates bacterium]|nr:MAG: hypothetical protein C4559_04290 [Candidatus Microgenomates bacterium]
MLHEFGLGWPGKHAFFQIDNSTGLGLYQAISPDVKKLHEPHFELLESLQPFSGSYGVQDVWNFCQSFEQSIGESVENYGGKKSNVLGLIGEPVSGKSTIERLVAQWLLRENGVLAGYLMNGWKLDINVLPWGDPFYTIDGGLKANSEMSKEELQTQVDAASARLEDILYKKIEEPSDPDEKTIKIITFDIPSTVGFSTSTGRVGIDRTSILPNLIQRKGRFESIAEFYNNPKIIGLSASNKVRRKGKEDRTFFESANGDDEAEAEKRGLIFHKPKGVGIAVYTMENAQVRDVLEIEKQVNESIIYLANANEFGKIRFEKSAGAFATLFPEEYGGRKEITEELLTAFPDDRAELIGENLIPWIGQNILGINERDIIVLHNSKPLNRIDICVGFPHRYPVREAYPDKFVLKKNGSIYVKGDFRA